MFILFEGSWCAISLRLVVFPPVSRSGLSEHRSPSPWVIARKGAGIADSTGQRQSSHCLVSFMKAAPGAGAERNEVHRPEYRACMKEGWRSLYLFCLF